MTRKQRPGSPWRPFRCWAVALLCASTACTVADGNLGRLHAQPGNTGASCALTSPIVSVAGAPTCPGRLAASLLTNALCVCGDAQVATTLVTRGFDSRHGPYASMSPDQGGASVAVNGTYIQRLGTVDVGGSFSVAGSADMRFTGAFTVRGDLWSGGNVSVTGAAGVSRNAWLAGTFNATGPLLVAGALSHAGTVTAVPLLSGSDHTGPVAVSAACPCAPSDLLDIGAIVDGARADNDNQSLHVAADQLAALAGPPVTMAVPCGRVYLTGIGGRGNVTIHVNGMTAIFVDGSIALTGNLVFDIAPGAELDVFVRGDTAVIGTFTLAKQEHPSAGRIWIGGSHAIGPLLSPWVGTLYAPHASVSAAVALTVYGAIFAGSFSGDVASTFIFDRSILNPASCAAPQPAAGSCRQCGTCSAGDACVGGACTACATDADCCGLSICANGSCAPLMEPTSGPP